MPVRPLQPSERIFCSALNFPPPLSFFRFLSPAVYFLYSPFCNRNVQIFDQHRPDELGNTEGTAVVEPERCQEQIHCSKRYRNFSVGKVNVLINGVIYLVCALMFNVETAIYCIIYAAISSFTVDRIHSQNIMIQVTIFTKQDFLTRRAVWHAGHARVVSRQR